MQEIIDFLNQTTLTVPVIIFRLVYGSILGSIVGLEREMKNQAAGLRTHMLICLGATMLMLLSIYIPQHYGVIGGDPGRIAAQVVSGIGFLGAGAIVRMGMDVRGLTTAASIWVIAALGLVSGAGMYLTALVATLMMLFALQFLDNWLKKILPKSLNRRILIAGEGLQARMTQIRQVSQGLGVEIRGVSFEFQVKKESSSVVLDVKIPEHLHPEEIITRLSNLEGIKRVGIEFTG
jgi:putative Mg2+ transporter-C (MgtC) family protein